VAGAYFLASLSLAYAAACMGVCGDMTHDMPTTSVLFAVVTRRSPERMAAARVTSMHIKCLNALA